MANDLLSSTANSANANPGTPNAFGGAANGGYGLDPMQAAGAVSEGFPEQGPQAQPSTGVGEALRAMREEAGYTIEALASALKVSLKRMEALEGNRFHELPDMVFARGLIGSVCRYLKKDPAPILSMVPSGLEQRPKITAPESETRFEDNAASEGSNWGAIPWRYLALAGVVLLAALVVMFLPKMDGGFFSGGRSSSSASPDGSTNGSLTQSPSQNIASGPPAAVQPAAAAATVAAAPENTPTSMVSPTVANDTNLASQQKTSSFVAPVVPVAPVPPQGKPATNDLGGAELAAQATSPASNTSPTAISNAADTALTNAGDNGQDLIVFKGIDESWVSVRDANGKEIFGKLVRKDEILPVKASPPLQVKVGKADGVEVTVRGQLFDMSSYSKGNVARFKVQ